jgi:hypothetical protein
MTLNQETQNRIKNYAIEMLQMVASNYNMFLKKALHLKVKPSAITQAELILIEYYKAGKPITQELNKTFFKILDDNQR